MKSGGRLLHHDTPMPKHPLRQVHEKPKTGDNRGAIHRAAGRPFDGNVTYVAKLRDEIDGLWGTNLLAHYGIPYLNGYRFLPNGRKVPIRKRHWTYGKWGPAGLLLKRANGEHTLTLNRALELCAKAGAIPIKETKSRAFAKSDRPWKLLNRDCAAHDVPNWSKALVTMFGFKGKVIRAARNAVPLVAIYGKGLTGRARRLARTRRLQRGWKDGTRVYATW